MGVSVYHFPLVYEMGLVLTRILLDEDDNSFLEQLAEADFDYADGEMILEDTDG
jgi:hypothetical protein